MNAEKHDLDCAFWFGERCDCRTQEADNDSIKRKDEDTLVDEIRRKWRIGPKLLRSYGSNGKD
jgi:hypothetical protein